MPTTRPATGGTGASVRTYFDATFGANNIRRLLVCNTSTALQVAAAQVPEFTVVLLVVNSTVYGGSGGSVGTYSLADGANEIALHEMGHTAFGLADEYAFYAGGNETGHDHHPPGEPSEPNVTTNADRNTLKWRWAVAATTAIPTMSNPIAVKWIIGQVQFRPAQWDCSKGRTIITVALTGPNTTVRCGRSTYRFAGSVVR